MRETWQHRVTTEEDDWLDRIARMRKQLEASDHEFEYCDFGAGTHSGDIEPQGQDVPMRISTVRAACRASEGPRGGLLLLKLVRQLQPDTVLELGTNIGISASYIGAALETNRHGRLVTLEGSPGKAAIAQKNWDALHIARVEAVVGPFRETLEPTLRKLSRIDFAFVDGHHHGPSTCDYFQTIATYAPVGSVILFDDIRWSPDMMDAWARILADPRVAIGVDLGTKGLCVLGDGLRPHQGKPLRMRL